jgi:hypothetical protein
MHQSMVRHTPNADLREDAMKNIKQKRNFILDRISTLLRQPGKSSWAGVMAGVALATAALADNVEIRSISPSDYVSACGEVVTTVHVTFDGSAPQTLYYQTSAGTYGSNQVWTSDSDVVIPLSSTGAAGTNFTVDAWLAGGYGLVGLSDHKEIFRVEVTSVTPLVWDPVTETMVVPTWVLMPGTPISFWVELSTDAGNGSSWVPPSLTWSGATQDEDHWAYGAYNKALVDDVTATIGCSAAAVNPAVVQYMLTVRTITFGGEGFASVLQDATGNAFPTPHWSYDPTDNEIPYEIYPVQYYRSEYPQVSVVFDVSPSGRTAPIYVKITGKVNSDSYTPDGASHLTIEDLTLPGLSGYVCLEDCQLDWKWSLDGSTWYSADGAPTQHPIYQTLGAPSAHFHTAVHVACNAVDASDEGGVLTINLCSFAGRAIYTVDNQLMRFFAEGNNTPRNCPYNQALFSYGTQPHYDGVCDHWCSFLVEVLAVNGMSSSIKQLKPVIPDNFASLEVADSAVGQGGTTKNPSADTQPVNWTGIFNTHFVVLKGSTLLVDPSFGCAFTTTDELDPIGDLEKQWEDTTGYLLKCIRRYVPPGPPYTSPTANNTALRELQLVNPDP